MGRPALVLVTAAVTLAALTGGGTAAPAGAAPTGALRLTVGDTATVDRSGSTVRWPVSFVCPRHERYTLDGFLSEYGSDAPWDDGGDLGVDAGTLGSVDARGRCTGREQTRTLRLRVQRHEGVFWPFSPSRSITSQATLVSQTATAFDCGGPACAESTGTRVTVVRR